MLGASNITFVRKSHQDIPPKGGQHNCVLIVFDMLKIPVSLLCYYYNTRIYKGQPLSEINFGPCV